MRFDLGVFVPGAIDEVFDFLDDPSNIVGLGGHAAEHVRSIAEIAADDQGRRTFDIKMQAGPRTWMQTVQQVVRDRPTCLVTRGWTWVNDREDPALRVTTERRLQTEEDGTRLSMTIDFEPQKLRRFARVLSVLQRGQTRLELEHQLHFLAERFASRDIARR
jgi:hypothetical protein